MISSSDILHGKVLIVDDKEANVLLLDRTLRGAIDVKGKGRKPQQYAQAGSTGLVCATEQSVSRQIG